MKFQLGVILLLLLSGSIHAADNKSSPNKIPAHLERAIVEQAQAAVARGFSNYYEVLGVSRYDSHEDIIKKGRRKLARIEAQIAASRKSGEQTQMQFLLAAKYNLIKEAVDIIANENHKIRKWMYDKQLDEIKRIRKEGNRRVKRYIPKKGELIRDPKYNPLHGPDLSTVNEHDRQLKSQKRSARLAHITSLGTGTLGFMGAMLFHGMLRGLATDNPYMRYATWDSLADPRGAGLLLSFGVIAGISNQYINKFLLSRRILRKPTNGAGMAIAVVGNHFLEKVFYSQGWNVSKLYATEYWDRTKEFFEKKTRRDLNLRELGIKIKRAHDIEEELLKLKEFKRLSDAEQQTIEKVKELTLELKNINEEYRHPYWNASWEALAQVAVDAQRMHPGEWKELSGQIARLLIVIAAVDKIFHKVGDSIKKVKGNKKTGEKKIEYMRKLRSFVRQVKTKDLPKWVNISPLINSREQFANLQFVGKGGQAFRGLLRTISQKIGLRLSRLSSRAPLYLTRSIKAMPLQVLHGMAFLEGETQLKKIQDHLFKPSALRKKENDYRKNMYQNVMEFVQFGREEDLEKINDLRKDWMEHWYKYEEFLFLDFYNRYIPWVQNFEKLSTDYTKKEYYLNWLLGGGEFSSIVYSDTSLGFSWHQNRIHRVAFQKEVEEYETFLRKSSPNVSLTITEEGVEISGHNVEAIKRLLAQEKRSLETRLTGERVEFLKHAQKFLEKSYFDGKMPPLLNFGHHVGAFFDSIQKKIGIYYPNAPYNKVRSYQVQLDNLFRIYKDFLNMSFDFSKSIYNEQASCKETFDIENLTRQKKSSLRIINIEDRGQRASAIYNLASEEYNSNLSLFYSHMYSAEGEDRACVLSKPELRVALIRDLLILDMYNTGLSYKMMPQEILQMLQVDIRHEPVIANNIYSDIIVKSRERDQLIDSDRDYFWSLEEIQEEIEKRAQVQAIRAQFTRDEDSEQKTPETELGHQDLQKRLDKKYFPQSVQDHSQSPFIYDEETLEELLRSLEASEDLFDDVPDREVQ